MYLRSLGSCFLKLCLSKKAVNQSLVVLIALVLNDPRLIIT